MAYFRLIYGILGSLAALISAGAWAFSSILFRKLGDEISPLGMNLGKCIIGILYLGVTVLFIGIAPVSSHAFLFLGASGLLGIACGDTFFFKTLIYLGPRLTLLLETLGPAVTVLLAVIFLRERPSPLVWTGILLTLGGISWVLWEDSSKEKNGKNMILGVKYAILFVLCNSIGIILAKIGVVAIPTLQATFIRLFWGFIGLSVWGYATRQVKNWLIPFSNPRLLKFIFFAAFVAIFGGFWLSLLALKYIDVSIATILSSTTPLFILPMSAFILKEKISIHKIIGAVVAVAGVVLVFLR